MVWAKIREEHKKCSAFQYHYLYIWKWWKLICIQKLRNSFCSENFEDYTFLFILIVQNEWKWISDDAFELLSKTKHAAVIELGRTSFSLSIRINESDAVCRQEVSSLGFIEDFKSKWKIVHDGISFSHFTSLIGFVLNCYLERNLYDLLEDMFEIAVLQRSMQRCFIISGKFAQWHKK